MNKLIIFTAFCFFLICSLICFYFVSPNYQVSALQSENYHLKSELAALQGNNESELVVIVVCGMLSMSIILLTGFFLLLCILAKVRPAEFFSVRPVLAALPVTQARQEIPQQEAEIIHYPETHYNDDRYAMIWEV